MAAGCGALAPSLLCLTERGWVGLLHARLAASLVGGVRLDAYPKGSIRTEYFTECTHEKVAAHAHVVILELQPNVWMTGQPHCKGCAADLDNLVWLVRTAAPTAAVLFVGSPLRRKQVTMHSEALIAAAAERGAWDAWLAGPLVRALEDRLAKDGAFNATSMHAASSSRGHALHADEAHPTAPGHELLAAGAAREILARVLPRGGHNVVTGRIPHASCAARTGKEQVNADGLELKPNAAVAEPGGGTAERCYLSADALPVGTSDGRGRQGSTLAIGESVNGWELVDEGGAKGVRKLGLLSRVPGQTLLLGPLLPERPRCAAVCVSVGYLHSWRTEQGALRLECDIGCSCAPRFLQVDTQARHGVKGERSANEVAHNPL